MVSPIIECHRCGKLVNTKDGKLKKHNAKNTNVQCIGSGEQIKK
jgi:Zn ribbon nucleic-acid-binding protein